MRSKWVVFVLACTILISGHAVSHAAPEAELWPRWEAHDPQSAATIDHGPWAQLLSRHIVAGTDGVNRVTYADFTPEERAALAQYIDDLTTLPISTYSRPEQMAYWINLYNALTVKVVLDHYPVDSIRDIDISPGWFSNGPWGKKLVVVEGEELSLDDIEHRILRPIWRDPRIHYAVNCAALGCPNLGAAPYLAATIDPQLDAAGRAYVNDPRGVHVDDDDLVVSSIYDWFMEDFGATEREVIEHLRLFADPDLDTTLERFDSIDDDEYDWDLNDAHSG
ncbi:MAG: DUF547 domain-containing protein [Pseudomonadota bacterium]